MKRTNIALLLNYLLICASISSASQHQAKSLELLKEVTIKNVGAAQGICKRNSKIYIYGDILKNSKHTGIIREYDLNFKPTGKFVWLTKNGKAILKHPTGLTWHKDWGTFMGDTVNGAGTIYQLDWEKMWKDSNLDRAIIKKIVDDAAINGSRPEFVIYKDKPYLASADYGNKNTEIRLYNPKLMLEKGRTSAARVIFRRAKCGPYNQNLCWDNKEKRLICIQNVTAGHGWCLDVLNLNTLFKENVKKARIKRVIISRDSELEGFQFYKNNSGIFVTSDSKNNLAISAPIKELQ